MSKCKSLPELETQEQYLFKMAMITVLILLAGTMILLKQNFPHKEPISTYACSDWISSSQRAAELYDSGVKLWNKADLVEIERQLTQSDTTEKFAIRRIDGTMIQIRNPLVDVQKPIWSVDACYTCAVLSFGRKPHVQFQGYWQLIKEQPQAPPETYHCSYLVKWTNQAVRRFRESEEELDLIFEDKMLAWNGSASYNLLSSYIDTHIKTRTVAKIVCFGLGDMFRRPPDWMRKDDASKAEITRGKDRRIFHHLIALTLAEICRNHGSEAVQLITQDPDYSNETVKFLERKGFTIFGKFGAEGFAVIDQDSIVFSPFAEAPVKQIIADLARPALIITNGFKTFNDSEYEISFQWLAPFSARVPRSS
ncbi:hypothetical protein ONS95_002238 [Cadophora gregata]|uniref:uncharacterized protein n=1 Tax=Cadophora gregata TaxID=51156 RepID=UPI0026DD840A|nr:uncharacterized protein ONS95_002238 [Cadophora gregata]KAK0109552.1 hypothetical protein ONS95_002238 [Cadophora gregata]